MCMVLYITKNNNSILCGKEHKKHTKNKQQPKRCFKNIGIVKSKWGI